MDPRKASVDAIVQMHLAGHPVTRTRAIAENIFTVWDHDTEIATQINAILDDLPVELLIPYTNDEALVKLHEQGARWTPPQLPGMDTLLRTHEAVRSAENVGHIDPETSHHHTDRQAWKHINRSTHRPLESHARNVL